MRKVIIAALVGAVVTATALGVGERTAHAAPPTCSASSPLLKAAAAWITFDGVTDGALYQIAEYGVWSASNPDADCIFVKVDYTAQGSERLWSFAGQQAEITGTLWFSPSYGLWEPLTIPFAFQKFSGATHGTPYTVMQASAELATVNQDISSDCIVSNATGYTLNGNTLPASTLSDSSGFKYTAGSNMAGGDTPLLCPQ